MKKTIGFIVVVSLSFGILTTAECTSQSAPTVCFAPVPAPPVSRQTQVQANEAVGANRFKPTWESLARHTAPEWFRDAKLGIYTHWGPITYATENAPDKMEWYARQMYRPNQRAFKYHQQCFGDQKTVGYKDVIGHFKAEKFNADEWAKLFKQAGAKFAGPVAIHHDNFAMWDSKVTKWNSAKMGPRRDITGELEKAIKKRGLKFITTFHHGYTWRYYEPAYQYDTAEAKYADLYGEPHKPGAPPTERYLEQWLAMVNEVVHKYEPDLIWFDFGLGRMIPAEYQRRMFADYYNWAAQHEKQVGVAHKHRDLHKWTGIIDFERGREGRLTPHPWLTDTSVGPWFHHKIHRLKSVNELVNVLVDIVSKNGCVLLNVGPAADGKIPSKGKEILLGIGDWLKLNGEAIYSTRPWQVYGEGPTRTKGGAFSESKDPKKYTAQDIRFTSKGNVVYAIVLDWPDAGTTVTIRSLADKPGAIDITHIKLLGHNGKLNWKRDQEELKIQMPSKKPCEHAFVLKITPLM